MLVIRENRSQIILRFSGQASGKGDAIHRNREIRQGIEQVWF